MVKPNEGMNTPGGNGTHEKTHWRRIHGPAGFPAAQVSAPHATGAPLHGVRWASRARVAVSETPGQGTGEAAQETGPQTPLPRHSELQAGGAGSQQAPGHSPPLLGRTQLAREAAHAKKV